MLSHFGRRYSSKVLGPFISFLNRIGVGPNALSLAGLIMSLGAGMEFSLGALRKAAIFVFLAGLFDLMDGEVARRNNKESRFGAFLDSSLDRYGEGFIFSGLIYHYLGSPLNVLIAVVAFLGAYLTSYTKARAENFISNCSVGLIERPERMILIIIGGLTNKMELILWFLSISSNLTAFQRIKYTKEALKKDVKN